MRDAVVVYCDGGSRGNPGPAGIGVIVLDPSTNPPETLATVSEAIGIATNNVAEYRALIAGLEAATLVSRGAVEVRADSQLMIRQLQGAYRVRHPGLRPLWERAQQLLLLFESVTLTHVPREENTVADALVNDALDRPS